MKEIQIVIKNLKNNKASGTDNILAEVWEAGICNEQLLYVSNRVFNSNLLIYKNKVASFLYQKKVTCALLPTTEELV